MSFEGSIAIGSVIIASLTIAIKTAGSVIETGIIIAIITTGNIIIDVITAERGIIDGHDFERYINEIK